MSNNVTRIGYAAFRSCSALTSITLSTGLKTIEFSVFEDCTSLKSITIPRSVTEIEFNVFSGCSACTIYCEVSKKPAKWDNDWNPDNRPVVWGNCSPVKLGDVNGDGKVNSMDYNKVKRHALGLLTLTGDEFTAGDVDGNGKINAMDYNKVKRCALGLITLD